MRRTPILIVGGGPAGSAAAITLARGGVAPELIDRSTGERDLVCGGFLGWDAIAALRRLGLDPAALGARPITRVRLVAGTGRAEAALPRAAAGLSRRRLDASLLALAGEAGAKVTRGRTARAVEGDRVRLDDGEEIVAESLFLATGKHEVRGVARDLEQRREPPTAGLRAELPPRPDLAAGLAGVVELHLYDGGYAGLLLQEDGSANLCLAISRDRLSAAGGPAPLIEELLAEAPLLGERLGGNMPGAWEAVAGVPYGWRTESTRPGLFRLGDQAAVIASLAGDGIAIALTSGEAAAQAYLARGPSASPAFQQSFARHAARPVKVAETLRHMAERRVPRRIMLGLLQMAPGLARAAARLTRVG
jgi:flavin-dependent dehydrogenase